MKIKLCDTLRNLSPAAVIFAVTASSNAAIIYSLNPSMTNLPAGIAYWDTTEVVSGGTLVGFHQVTSQNSPNILSASPDSSQFNYDTGVASLFNMTWESSFMSSGGGSGGGLVSSPSFDEGPSTLFVADTNGSQMLFNLNSEFVSGDGIYGPASGMSGQTLVAEDSGSGGNAFISGASGSEWEVEVDAVISDGTSMQAGAFYNFSFAIAGDGQPGIGTMNFGAIPEPSSALLLGLGTLGLILSRSRR